MTGMWQAYVDVDGLWMQTFSKRLNDYGGIRTGVEIMFSKSGSTCYTRLMGCKERCVSPREVAEPEKLFLVVFDKS